MLRARMSLRLHMLSPATWGGFETPPLAALYFHHPIGYHHILTLLIPIFGDHEWLARGVAVAGGLVALWALYVLVRAFWSREAGLVAVAVYVALPVLTSFSVLSDPMLLGDGLRPLVAVGLSVAARKAVAPRARARLFRLRARRLHHVGGLLHRPLHRRPLDLLRVDPSR